MINEDVGRILICQRCGVQAIEKIKRFEITKSEKEFDPALLKEENFTINEEWHKVLIRSSLTIMDKGEWTRGGRKLENAWDFWLCPECQKIFKEKEKAFFKSLCNEFNFRMPLSYGKDK